MYMFIPESLFLPVKCHGYYITLWVVLICRKRPPITLQWSPVIFLLSHHSSPPPLPPPCPQPPWHFWRLCQNTYNQYLFRNRGVELNSQPYKSLALTDKSVLMVLWCIFFRSQWLAQQRRPGGWQTTLEIGTYCQTCACSWDVRTVT